MRTRERNLRALLLFLAQKNVKTEKRLLTVPYFTKLVQWFGETRIKENHAKCSRPPLRMKLFVASEKEGLVSEISLGDHKDTRKPARQMDLRTHSACFPRFMPIRIKVVPRAIKSGNPTKGSICIILFFSTWVFLTSCGQLKLIFSFFETIIAMIVAFG